ncbi:MAG TPA: hypothetical protein VGB15_05535, partial [Longimicrobium sp.]
RRSRAPTRSEEANESAAEEIDPRLPMCFRAGHGDPAVRHARNDGRLAPWYETRSPERPYGR